MSADLGADPGVDAAPRVTRWTASTRVTTAGLAVLAGHLVFLAVLASPRGGLLAGRGAAA